MKRKSNTQLQILFSNIYRYPKLIPSYTHFSMDNEMKMKKTNRRIDINDIKIDFGVHCISFEIVLISQYTFVIVTNRLSAMCVLHISHRLFN